MTRIKTGMLLAALTALVASVGGALGGESGLVMALLVVGVMNLGVYWFSDRIVLRMHGAQPLTEVEAPELYALVRRLARAAYLPMPQFYRIPDAAPNAFATGRNPEHAVVAVTQGLLDRLDREELAGVIAHELAHIRNRATLVMTVAATLAGAVSMLANLEQWSLLFRRSNDDGEATPNPLASLVGILVAPLAAALIQKRCGGCGFTVRCAVALASPGGPIVSAYRRVAVAVTGDGKRLNRSGSGFRWRYRPVAVGQWRWREEQRWTERSIKAVPDPWAYR
jgi:heat shock protein HtpX